MKQTIIVKSLIIAGATLLGFAATSRAQDPVPATGTMGLLGQTYAGLDYSYNDLHHSPTNADSFGFQYNQALSAGFDALLNYDWTQSGLVLGDRARQQTLGGALRAFSTSYTWGKPFVEAGGGWTWVKDAGVRDNSLTWEVAVGSEFQVTPKVSVTPYVRYEDAPDLSDNETWNFGVKGNYWVNTRWAVSAGINYNDNHATAFTVGTNYRF